MLTQENFEKQIPWDWIWGYFSRVIVMHAIFVTWTIVCYNYSYCVSESEICILILCCCICSIFGSWSPRSNESWAKLLSISLSSSFRGHPGLAKYCTVWATFSRYFLLDAFSLACAIWTVNAYVKHLGKL